MSDEEPTPEDKARAAHKRADRLKQECDWLLALCSQLTRISRAGIRVAMEQELDR